MLKQYPYRDPLQVLARYKSQYACAGWRSDLLRLVPIAEGRTRQPVGRRETCASNDEMLSVKEVAAVSRIQLTARETSHALRTVLLTTPVEGMARVRLQLTRARIRHGLCEYSMSRATLHRHLLRPSIRLAAWRERWLEPGGGWRDQYCSCSCRLDSDDERRLSLPGSASGHPLPEKEFVRGFCVSPAMSASLIDRPASSPLRRHPAVPRTRSQASEHNA